MFAAKKKAVSTTGTTLSHQHTFATLQGLSSNLMIADPDYNIIFANEAVLKFLREYESQIRKDLPHFSVDTLIGSNIDIFHKNPAHQRSKMGDMTGDIETSIKVGGLVFNLRVFPLLDGKGTRIGTTVEWKDSVEMDNASQIVAINRSMATIEFDLDGTILNANKNFLDTVGYDLSEIQGKHHRMFVDPEEGKSQEYRDFWASLKEGKYQAAEYKRFGKGGREIWIQASYNPVTDLNGRPFKVVKYATDITKQINTKQINMVRDIGKMMLVNLSEITSAVETVNTQTTSASGALTQTSSNVQTVAAGAEELHASVQEIADNMSKSRTEADSAVNRVTTAVDETGKLAEAAQEMNNIVELIRGIADQVNLLALNATIEAARAGEAGKGFAVVATEVKNLATQTGQATDKIGEQIGGIQGIVDRVVKSLEDIRGSIDSLNSYVAGAAGAVEEQSAVAQDMSSNMQSAASAVDDISRSLRTIVETLGVVQSAIGTATQAADDLAKK